MLQRHAWGEFSESQWDPVKACESQRFTSALLCLALPCSALQHATYVEYVQSIVKRTLGSTVFPLTNTKAEMAKGFKFYVRHSGRGADGVLKGC